MPRDASKAGWKTSEFWLTTAAHANAALVASGLFELDSPWLKGAVFLGATLAQLGYTASRAWVKSQ